MILQRRSDTTRTGLLTTSVVVKWTLNGPLRPCQECDKTFIRQTSLESHVKSYHSRDRFYTREGHMMLSTTEKVAKNTRFYFCDQCDYKTSKQANLKRHKNKHNKPPKPIRSKHCEKCNFTFTTYYKFKVHYV